MRGDVDRPGGGVLAVKRPLGTAQDFDLGDVEEVERGGGDARVIDVVDIDADALVEAIVGQPERHTDAADIHGRVARVRAEKVQRGSELLQSPDVESAGVIDLLAADDGNRQGNVLRGFEPAPRADDYDVFIGGGGGLRR